MEPSPDTTGAIVVGAGSGRRMGGVPKALLHLDGVALVVHALRTVRAVCGDGPIAVACIPGRTADFKEAAGEEGLGVRFVNGGETRVDSVLSAFAAIAAECSIVLVHDAARPFATVDLAARVAAAALVSGAAVPIIPVTDTVKRIVGDVVSGTLDRGSLGLVQTPQGFRRELLEAALAAWKRDGRPPVTDDASLVERLGVAVAAVEGERGNVKITWPGDLPSAGDAVRTGLGYDLHRIVADRPLVLGGVPFDCGFGLLGHSDADVVLHAICDAVLGAAGLGDIGRMFPDTDPRWKGADSAALLATAVAEVHCAGFTVINVDCTVIAERPKVAPAAAQIASRIAACLAIDPGRVSVKGKTNEGLGPEGRGEAISAHAVVLLRKSRA